MSLDIWFLRCVWSVLCVIGAGLLLALCVRSFWRKDSISGGGRIRMTQFCSFRGRLSLYNFGQPIEVYGSNAWVYGSATVDEVDKLGITEPATFANIKRFGFGWNAQSGIVAASVPHWFVVILLAGLAFTPWAF